MGEKILVIEDDPETRDSITLWLELAGFTVVVANDGLEGLAVLLREQPNLVITDVAMPGLNGIEMIRSARQPFSAVRKVPIIVLTGYYMDLATQAISAGANQALSKPVNPNVLVAHVKHLLNPLPTLT